MDLIHILIIYNNIHIIKIINIKFLNNKIKNDNYNKIMKLIKKNKKKIKIKNQLKLLIKIKMIKINEN